MWYLEVLSDTGTGFTFSITAKSVKHGIYSWGTFPKHTLGARAHAHDLSFSHATLITQPWNGAQLWVFWAHSEVWHEDHNSTLSEMHLASA